MNFFRKRLERLPAHQVHAYETQGFVVVSGLIAETIIDQAASLLADLVRGEGGGPHITFYRNAELLACYTKEVCWAAAQLAGGGAGKPFPPPRATSTISVGVTAEPWRWPHPHIDHSRREDEHRTFPPPYRIGCIIYLTEVPKHSGSTVIWPGSHRQLEALAASNVHQYEYMSILNRDLPTLTLENPIEVTAHPGDVFFHHYLCAHSGSVNNGSEPRLALNHKW
jgi:hypothetical protein